MTANALPPTSKIKDSENPKLAVELHSEDPLLDMNHTVPCSDVSDTSTFPIGGVAERLMQYGRNYLEIFRYFSPLKYDIDTSF